MPKLYSSFSKAILLLKLIQSVLRLFSRVCFQVQEGPYDVQESLEEFLSMWICVNEKYFVLKSADGNLGDLGGWEHPFAIGVDKYVEVVEVYAVTLLAMLLRDVDHAISWVEKSALPDQKKQVTVIF